MDHPAEGSYELTYGKSIEHNYCRPIFFEKHTSEYQIKSKGEEVATVSGTKERVVSERYSKLCKGIPELDTALEYYNIAKKVPTKSDNVTIEYENSFHRRLLEQGIEKLNKIENRVPQCWRFSDSSRNSGS